MKKRIFRLLLFLLIVVFFQTGITNSFFSDNATVDGNSMTAGYWVTPTPTPSPSPSPSPTPTPTESPSPSPTPTPTPTSTPTPAPTGPVVINEVYYDVGGVHGTEPDNEWVELYNNADYDINLKNWSLTDSEGVTGSVTSDVTIPAKGFAVLSNEDTTWPLWSILPGVPTINLGGSVLQLGNSGDFLTLKDSTNNPVDFVAWENHSPGWNLFANDDQSIARIVKGVDTDSPLDWQVLTSPNPGTNPHPALETNLDFYFVNGVRYVGFKLSGKDLALFDKYEYKITYASDSGEQAIIGSGEVAGKSEITEGSFILGYCSTGGTCVYHAGVKVIDLEVILKGPVERTIHKQLTP